MNINIIGEAGINCNGNVQNAKTLIDICYFAGVNMFKIQKRDPDICVPEHQKDVPKSTPWGTMSYLEYKKKIEFSEDDCNVLNDYCHTKNLTFFASVWDIPSCDIMSKITTLAKIPSALITDIELCKYARDKFDTLMISTGMSDEIEIEQCIKICDPDVIFHTNSTYPTPDNELNLNYIKYLINKYPNKEIGYSCHSWGLTPSFAAASMGIKHIEKHITTDHLQFGSDQSSSVEPIGIIKWVNGIRCIEKGLGEYGPRKVLGGELSKRKSLRGD